MPLAAERQLAPEPLPSVGGPDHRHGRLQVERQFSCFLGAEVDLASGLMEITYDTGAKVILQGPVTYEVETNGGYLAVGKVDGEAGEESGQWSVVSGQ